MNRLRISMHRQRSVTFHRHASPRVRRLKAVQGASFLFVLVALMTATAPVSTNERFFGTGSISSRIP